ncbi:MAG: RnfH family protein [Pseudomonas sp.]|nr:RnfH family protein [Pseudomonas sp.]MDY0414614.1 RnfH family protein [Pseudomonas sp.]
MDKPMITVEVAYALAHKQKIVQMQVPQGTTARDAALGSGLESEFADIDLQHSPLGIFGKNIARPQEHCLEDGDRVEIYRPLLADPKEVRKQRAERVAQAKAAEAAQTTSTD